MTPRSRATVTGRIKEPQTLSSPVSRWEHRLLVAHQRNFVFSELRQSLLDRIHSAICSSPISILRRCNPSDEGWPHETSFYEETLKKSFCSVMLVLSEEFNNVFIFLT